MARKIENRITELADQFERELLEDDEAKRTFRDDEPTKEERENELWALTDTQDDIRRSLIFSEHEYVSSIADAVIEENNLDGIREDRKAYQLLCRELLKAFDRATTVLFDRHNGVYTDDRTIAPIDHLSAKTKQSIMIAKREPKRPEAKWLEIESELRRMAENGELVRNPAGNIHRLDTSKILREWYRQTHNDEAFQSEKSAGADTIRKQMKLVFDELGAEIRTKSG